MAEIDLSDTRTSLDLSRGTLEDAASMGQHLDALAQVHDEVHVMFDHDDSEIVAAANVIDKPQQ